MSEIKLLPYQDRFVFDDEHKYHFLKAGWATGKSMSLILACARQCELYPDNLGVIYRKEAVDLRDSTIRQFEQMTGIKVDSTRQAKFKNGSVLMFRHKEDIFGTVQNINLGFAGIEEHAEIESDDLFYLLFGRLRRKDTGLKIFSVGNACGHNWVYKIKMNGIYDQGKRMDLHLSATTHENAENLPSEFIKSLETLKVKKPKYYDRFVMNSDNESDIDVIIQPEWIQAATRRDLIPQVPIKRVVSIDVARYGDDKTIFYALENNIVIGREEHEKKSTMEVVGLAQLFARKHKNINTFAVDEIGVGAGVADRLQELEKKIIFVNSSKKSNQNDKYYNLRAEIYSYGAEILEAGRAEIQPDDQDLIEQLSWAKYKTIKSNGVYQVESKDDIKERYGRSPDNADCYLNGLWALQDGSCIVKEQDKYARHRNEVVRGPAMAVLG